MIEGQNISVAIDGKTILDGDTIRCESGVMTALVGPNGSGKTTLLHCLGLLLPVDKGHIFFNGKDVTNYNSANRRRFWRDYAAFVLQDYGIMENESVAFNVTMKTNILGRDVKGNQELLKQALERTGLQGLEENVASHLSGGEKQRLALARAIYKNATVLFVDEPTASLDATNRQKVIDLFADFAHQGCTVVVSTHDSDFINACSVQYRIGSSTDTKSEEGGI